MPCEITAPFEPGTIYTLEPWRAEWLISKFEKIARLARRSGVQCSPSLTASGSPYVTWRPVSGERWGSRRDANGGCLYVQNLRAMVDRGEIEMVGVMAISGCVCAGGVCPHHWDELVVQDFRAGGRMPVLPGGWHLVAAIDRLRVGAQLGADGATVVTPAQTMTIVREVPGRQCPAEFRGESAADRCDHCQVDRRRSVVYVLADDAGKHVQVGSTCIAEFIRDPNVEKAIDAMLRAYAAWAGVPSEDEDGNPIVSRRKGLQPLGRLLGMVAAYVRENRGVFLTRAAAGDGSTGNQADAALEASTDAERRRHPDLREPRDHVTASAAIAWAAGLPETGSAFEQNMRAMARCGCYDPKHLGVAAYIVAAHARAQGAARAVAAPVPVKVRLSAEVGSFAVRELEVVRVASWDGTYGTTYVTVMRVLPGGAVGGASDPPVADVGALVAWRSKETPSIRSAQIVQSHVDAHDLESPELTRGNGVRCSVKAGDRLIGRFKVKSHDEYKGAPQTEVSHFTVACDGWGFSCEGSPDLVAYVEGVITAGGNAPALPIARARTRKAKPVAA